MTKSTAIGSQFDNSVLWISDIKKKKIDGKEKYVVRLDGISPFKFESYIVEALASKEVKIISKRK
jgi:hypothetical protein